MVASRLLLLLLWWIGCYLCCGASFDDENVNEIEMEMETTAGADVNFRVNLELKRR